MFMLFCSKTGIQKIEIYPIHLSDEIFKTDIFMISELYWFTVNPCPAEPGYTLPMPTV